MKKIKSTRWTKINKKLEKKNLNFSFENFPENHSTKYEFDFGWGWLKRQGHFNDVWTFELWTDPEFSEPVSVLNDLLLGYGVDVDIHQMTRLDEKGHLRHYYTTDDGPHWDYTPDYSIENFFESSPHISGSVETRFGFLKHLNASVQKWNKIVNVKEKDLGTNNCPLCQHYGPAGGLDCTGCPIYYITGRKACRGTPYEYWLDHQKYHHYKGTKTQVNIIHGETVEIEDDSDFGPPFYNECETCKAIAKAEVKFLKEVRQLIIDHPTIDWETMIPIHCINAHNTVTYDDDEPDFGGSFPGIHEDIGEVDDLLIENQILEKVKNKIQLEKGDEEMIDYYQGRLDQLKAVRAALTIKNEIQYVFDQ